MTFVIMLDWRLTIAWLGLASLGSVSAAGLSGKGGAAHVIAMPAMETSKTSEPAPFVSEQKSDTFSARRSADGLFYLDATIDGAPVRFLVDTGATNTMLAADDAARIRANAMTDQTASVVTAGGIKQARWARLHDVVLSGVNIGTIDMLVPNSDLPVSLLGQDALSRLGSLTIEGNRLTIRNGSTAEQPD